MKVESKKAINELLETLIDEVVQVLEENRHYPSVKEAGTAPTESALDECKGFVQDFLVNAQVFIKNEDASKAFKNYSIEDLKLMINGKNMEEFEELEHVESFVDNGDLNEKYVYLNEVFQYKPTNSHLKVVTQRVNDRDRDFLSLVNVSDVEKKEVITYEWL